MDPVLAVVTNSTGQQARRHLGDDFSQKIRMKPNSFVATVDSRWFEKLHFLKRKSCWSPSTSKTTNLLYTFPFYIHSSHIEALILQGLWLPLGSGTTPSASFPPRLPRSPRSSLATMGWLPASPGHHLRRIVPLVFVFVTITNQKTCSGVSATTQATATLYLAPKIAR